MTRDEAILKWHTLRALIRLEMISRDRKRVLEDIETEIQRELGRQPRRVDEDEDQDDDDDDDEAAS